MRASELTEVVAEEGIDFGPPSLGPIAVIREALPNNEGTVSSDQKSRILQDHNCVARTRGRKRYPDRELLVIGRVDRLRPAYEAAWLCIRGEDEARPPAQELTSAAPRRMEPRPPPHPPPAPAMEPLYQSGLPRPEIPLHDSWDIDCSEGAVPGASLPPALARACCLRKGCRVGVSTACCPPCSPYNAIIV